MGFWVWEGCWGEWRGRQLGRVYGLWVVGGRGRRGLWVMGYGLWVSGFGAGEGLWVWGLGRGWNGGMLGDWVGVVGWRRWGGYSGQGIEESGGRVVGYLA